MKIKDILSEEQLDELSFFGRPCTKDCSGHKAGWEWERKHNLQTRQTTPSNSFNNGTEIATNQTKAGLRPLGYQIRGDKGRFQKFKKTWKNNQVLRPHYILGFLTIQTIPKSRYENLQQVLRPTVHLVF